MYTALVLDQASKNKLVQLLSTIAPDEYDEVIAHHMTINMGSCQFPPLLGQPFSMKVVAIGRDEKVIAAQVETECESKIPRKHITMAVNRAKGGKPVMSNQITTWEPYTGNLILNGVVEECS